MRDNSPWVITGILGACLIVALAAAYVIVTPSSISTTSLTESSSSHRYTFSSGVSQNGLKLFVILNSTSILPHAAIGAQVEVLNTLNENVTDHELVPSQNISDWNPYDSLCPDQNPTASIVGFAIFKGRFSAGNISEAGAPLHMAPQFFPPGCGTEWGFPSSVTFLPDSGQMNASFNNAPQPSPPPALLSAALNATTFYCGGAEGIDCGLSPGLVGYWNYSIPNSGGDLTLSSPALVYFSPGEYTIVATDVWNQYVYANFVVESGH